MIPEQRDALDALLTSIRSGRLSRRTFLERAVALGLSTTAASSVLQACGGSSNSSGGNGASTNVIWQSEQDSTSTYEQLTATFNETIGRQKGIHVTWNQGPSNSDAILTRYTNTLRARNSSLDVISIDIVYPAQFASGGWLTPISEQQWPTSERQKYLPGPIKSCTYQNKTWAAPFRTDVGLLYYRIDRMPEPPRTWNELTEVARGAEAGVEYGYVWQGAQYEGLVCNFVEVLHGYGGNILDPNNPNRVLVNSPEAREALRRMVSWVGTISPLAVTTYQEDPSRQVWQNGDAAFMRNWPYAYALSNDTAQSKVAGKFNVTALPYGGSNTQGHSAIGGWNLAISAYSRYPGESWEFIKYLLQPQAQKKTAIQASLTVTLQSVYDDPDVLRQNPLFARLKPILQAALPRPVSPRYTRVSDAIQRNVYQALRRQVQPTDAIQNLDAALRTIIAL